MSTNSPWQKIAKTQRNILRKSLMIGTNAMLLSLAMANSAKAQIQPRLDADSSESRPDTSVHTESLNPETSTNPFIVANPQELLQTGPKSDPSSQEASAKAPPISDSWAKKTMSAVTKHGLLAAKTATKDAEESLKTLEVMTGAGSIYSGLQRAGRFAFKHPFLTTALGSATLVGALYLGVNPLTYAYLAFRSPLGEKLSAAFVTRFIAGTAVKYANEHLWSTIDNTHDKIAHMAAAATMMANESNWDDYDEAANRHLKAQGTALVSRPPKTLLEIMPEAALGALTKTLSVEGFGVDKRYFTSLKIMRAWSRASADFFERGSVKSFFQIKTYDVLKAQIIKPAVKGTLGFIASTLIGNK